MNIKYFCGYLTMTILTFHVFVASAKDYSATLGTESNGGFRNITITNCVFDHCRGLALETVDGAVLEDITISNISMRDIVNAPLFIRLGARQRGPKGFPYSQLHRVLISNIVAYDVTGEQGAIVSGIPGHDIEDLSLNDIHIYFKGGGTKISAKSRILK